MNSNEPYIQRPDKYCSIFHIEVPSSKIVLFYSFFELCEGLGIARTLEKNLCLMTTPSQEQEALAFLESIKEIIHWRFAK